MKFDIAFTETGISLTLTETLRFAEDRPGPRALPAESGAGRLETIEHQVREFLAELASRHVAEKR